MGTATKRRERQLALVTVAAPIAGSALEQTARRAEAGDQTSPTSRRLRQGADLVQRLGRGPLADRLRQWLADGHGRSAGFAAPLRQRPPGHTAAQSPRVRAFGAPGAILGAEGWFTEWHEGQPASVGTANPRRPAAGQPHSARPHLL